MYYNNDSVLFFDGEYVKAKEAKTDLYGQSLPYGYAVFEGVKSYKIANGTKISKAEEYYDRLRKSVETMMMPFDYTTEEMVEATYKLPKVADAGFLCGTAAEIVALDSLNNVPFKLTWTESVSSKIQKAYRHLVLKENYSYLKSDPQYV